MAGVPAVNPAATSVPHDNVSKAIQVFTIDYINAVNGSAGPQGVQQAVMRKIMDTSTILAAGPLGNSNTEQTYMEARRSLHTISSTTTVAAIQAAVRALNANSKITATISSATAADRDMGDTSVGA